MKKYKGPGREIQTLVFDRDVYTRKTALEWAKKHNFKTYTSRMTNNEIRLRQFPPNQVKKVLGRFNITEGISGLYVVKK